MMSCHLIPTWHEWNVNANDIMMTWYTLYVNPSDITLVMHVHMCMCLAHILYVKLGI